jgi:hypothetical protein
MRGSAGIRQYQSPGPEHDARLIQQLRLATHQRIPFLNEGGQRNVKRSEKRFALDRSFILVAYGRAPQMFLCVSSVSGAAKLFLEGNSRTHSLGFDFLRPRCLSCRAVSRSNSPNEGQLFLNTDSDAVTTNFDQYCHATRRAQRQFCRDCRPCRKCRNIFRGISMGIFELNNRFRNV